MNIALIQHHFSILVVERIESLHSYDAAIVIRFLHSPERTSPQQLIDTYLAEVKTVLLL
jgi:hypothetical protein